MVKRVAISFTGGKDSTLALTLAQLQRTAPDRLAVIDDDTRRRASELSDMDPGLLVTFVPSSGQAFKAHPLPWIQAQAEALGVPHEIVLISGPDYMASYTEAMKGLMQQHGIEALITGDILDVCNDFMGRAASGAGLPLIRPLWGIPRRQLLHAMWALNITALVSCVHLPKFDPAVVAGDVNTGPSGLHAAAGTDETCSGAAATGPATGVQQGRLSASLSKAAGIVGRVLDAQLHAEFLLPAAAACGVDECGEMGELHTMCIGGPTFKRSVVLHGAQVQTDETSQHAYLVPGRITLE